MLVDKDESISLCGELNSFFLQKSGENMFRFKNQNRLIDV